MKKKTIMLLLALAISGMLTGCNSEKSYYNKGVKAQESANYEEAIEYFIQAGDYEDSAERLAECEHLNDVANDDVAPSISGLEEEIDITCGTNFNLNDYVAEKIEITDNVTENIKDYTVSSDDVYDRGTGNVSTMEVGEHEVVVTAEDEAGNEGEARFTLSINPVIVSKDNPYPIIYDGEYATIELKAFKHDDIFESSGLIGYFARFEVENKCDKPIEVYWSSNTSINDYQVSAMHEVGSIAPGKKGISLTFIADENIPEEVGDFSQIDSIVCIRWENDYESFFKIPTTFYIDSIE